VHGCLDDAGERMTPPVSVTSTSPELSEQAFRLHYATVFRHLHSRLRDRQRAEDVTQEVFAEAVRVFGEPQRAPTVVLAWLLCVAERRLTDERRWRERRDLDGVLPLEAAEAVGLLAVHQLEERQTEARWLIDEAIQSLPAAQRRVVRLKLYHGLRFREVAFLLGLSESACRMRFLRATVLLREALRLQGVRL